MDKSNPLSTEKDLFCSWEVDEVILGSVVGALMYLANCKRPDISFAVILLERFSSYPTMRHWNRIKHIFRYLRETTDLGLSYSKDTNQSIIGYADTEYLSDPDKTRPQTGYVFTREGTAVSWRSQKQTLVTTSSNHSEIIALHETSRECVWLKSMTEHIQISCGLSFDKKPVTLYEDNAAFVLK